MIGITNTIISTLIDTVNRIILFIPQLVSGFVILAVGWVAALGLKYIASKVFYFIRIDKFLTKIGMKQAPSAKVWSGIASQVVFWFVFLSFLIPAFNVWQLPNMTALLNQVLFYIPSVFAAVVIGFIGYILANISYNFVKNAGRRTKRGVSDLLARVAQYSIYVFTALVVLNQLQIASNIIQLLLGGLVAMAALAGGLAFGLGGQEAAREMLSRLMHKRAQRSTNIYSHRRQPVFASQIRLGKKRAKREQKRKTKLL